MVAAVWMQLPHVPVEFADVILWTESEFQVLPGPGESQRTSLHKCNLPGKLTGSESQQDGSLPRISRGAACPQHKLSSALAHHVQEKTKSGWPQNTKQFHGRF